MDGSRTRRTGGITNGFHRVLVSWEKVPTYIKDPLWSQKQIKKLGEARDLGKQELLVLSGDQSHSFVSQIYRTGF